MGEGRSKKPRRVGSKCEKILLNDDLFLLLNVDLGNVPEQCSSKHDFGNLAPQIFFDELCSFMIIWSISLQTSSVYIDTKKNATLALVIILKQCNGWLGYQS